MSFLSNLALRPCRRIIAGAIVVERLIPGDATGASRGEQLQFRPGCRQKQRATGEGPVSSEANYPIVVEKNLAMRARDGVTLYADVYRPDAPGRFPVLVIRTPYDKGADNALTEKAYFPPRGYVVVVQDTRGRYASEGDFYPFLREAADGYDTVEWAAQLPWSSAKVGTVGQSYMAVVQYQVAATRPPHLVAMCPVSGSTSYFENSIWRRGVFELAYRLKYFIMMARETLLRQGTFDQRWPAVAEYLKDPVRYPLADDVRGHRPSAAE